MAPLNLHKSLTHNVRLRSKQSHSYDQAMPLNPQAQKSINPSAATAGTAE